MQKIVCIVLLAAFLVGRGTLFAQSAVPGPFSGKTPLRDSLHLSPMPDPPCAGALFKVWDIRKRQPFNRYSEESLSGPMDSVRIMSPDKMRCRVADMGRLEKMPVLRLQNDRPHDPMPNSLSRVPAVVPFGKLRFSPKE